MLAFPNMVDLFSYKFSCLSRWGLPFSFVLLCSFEGFSFWHFHLGYCDFSCLILITRAAVKICIVGYFFVVFGELVSPEAKSIYVR
jgi:hypothetical protein